MKWAGIGLLLVIGLIHLFESPDQFGDARYKGVLFLVNGVGCALAIAGIARRERWGWWLGAAVSLATAIGYVWSRTVGLPGLAVDREIRAARCCFSARGSGVCCSAVAVQLRSRATTADGPDPALA